MKIVKFFLVVVLVGVGFTAGIVFGRKSGAATSGPDVSGRKVLYWVDPMHPAYHSDRPGIAPDCGMTLEPVYADEGAAPPASGAATRTVLYYRDPKAPLVSSQRARPEPRDRERARARLCGNAAPPARRLGPDHP